VSRWVQSPSDYDTIVARTFTAAWAADHLPVISRRPGQHTLYTRFSLDEPRGQPVMCPNRCGGVMSSKTNANNLRFICKGCNSRATVEKFFLDTSTDLGKASFLKVQFPRRNYPIASWTSDGLLNGQNPPAPPPTTPPVQTQMPERVSPLLTPTPQPGTPPVLAPTQLAITGGEGQFTQWVHCEFFVGYETIRLAHTQQVSSERFQKVPTNSPNPNPAGHF